MRNFNDMNTISAMRTDDLDDIDIPSPNGPADPFATLSERDWFAEDIPPYEDDLDIDPRALDPVMAELTDDPTELFNVSPLAFRGELGRTAIDEGWDTERDDDDNAAYNIDDYRERVEDMDEDYDNAASAA